MGAACLGGIVGTNYPFRWKVFHLYTNLVINWSVGAFNNFFREAKATPPFPFLFFLFPLPLSMCTSPHATWHTSSKSKEGCKFPQHTIFYRMQHEHSVYSSVLQSRIQQWAWAPYCRSVMALLIILVMWPRVQSSFKRLWRRRSTNRWG